MEQEVLELKKIAYSNLSLCYIKLKQYQQAYDHANLVIHYYFILFYYWNHMNE